MSYKLDNVKILIVDDFKAILELLNDVLDAFGFPHVDNANTTDKAFELLCRHDHDLILLDWKMGAEDGIEFCKRVRKDPLVPNPYVPIILMTGYGSVERVELARDSGITEFLSKPFDANQLYKRIRKIIEKPRQFVKSEGYTGPDRRRRSADGYEGDERRK